MKNTIHRVFLILSILISVFNLMHAQLKTDDNFTRQKMNVVELEMLKEINAVRSNPQGYVQYVEKYIQEDLKDNPEEIASAKLLIEVLNGMKPLPPYESSECLFEASIIHAKDQSATSSIKHTGTDGSSPKDRLKSACGTSEGAQTVASSSSSSSRGYADNDPRSINIMLLIDHGNPYLSNRNSILSSKYTKASTASYNKRSEQYMEQYEVTMYTVHHFWVQSFGVK